MPLYQSPPAVPFAMPLRSSHVNATDVTVAVRRYAQQIGCDSSNTQAAIQWALRAPGHTLDAVRDGRRRADQLRARQTSVPA